MNFTPYNKPKVLKLEYLRGVFAVKIISPPSGVKGRGEADLTDKDGNVFSAGISTAMFKEMLRTNTNAVEILADETKAGYRITLGNV